MFVLLLLVSRVAGEWVEIAQNQYRKEPSRKLNVGYGEASKTNRIYINHSITERSWNRGVTRIPNIGNVKRVQLPSKSKDEFTIGLSHDHTFIIDKINIKGEKRHHHENLGAVRAPNLKNSKHSETAHVKRKNNDGNSTRETFSETNDKSYDYVPSRQVFRTQVSSNLYSDIFKHNRKETVENDKFQVIKASAARNHEISEINRAVERYPNSIGVHNISYIDKLLTNESNSKKYIKKIDYKIDIHDNLKDRKQEEISTETVNNKLYKIKNDTPRDPTIPNKINSAENQDKSLKNKSDITDANEKDKPSFENRRDNAANFVNSAKYPTNQGTINEDNKLANDSKNNTVQVLWKLIKVITDNISRNTQRSFKGKMRYLEVLRNNILSNIEERIEQAWPDDSQRRRRRAARGHVEFPSESALMTISFLTFAVFLVKLVLQVIHTYKNKTMMITPTVVAAVGRAAATLRKQKPN